MTTKSLRKSFLLAIVALFAFSCTSFAQEEAVLKSPGFWSVGAHGGANLSQFILGTKEVNKQYSFAYGYYAGLSVSYDFNKYFSLVGEANFSEVSATREGIQPTSPDATYFANFKKTERLDYIEVPIMARVTLGNRVKYYANAGPYVGYLAAANVKTSGNSLLYYDIEGRQPDNANGALHSFDASSDALKSFNELNFGLVGGLGAGYTFGNHGIWVDARYNIGLVNVRSNEATNGSNQLESVMLGLGYTYSFR